MLVKILTIVFLSFTLLVIISMLFLIRLMRNEIKELRQKLKDQQKEKERMEIRESARREQMTLAEAFEAMNRSMNELADSLKGFKHADNTDTSRNTENKEE